MNVYNQLKKHNPVLSTAVAWLELAAGNMCSS